MTDRYYPPRPPGTVRAQDLPGEFPFKVDENGNVIPFSCTREEAQRWFLEYVVGALTATGTIKRADLDD